MAKRSRKNKVADPRQTNLFELNPADSQPTSSRILPDSEAAERPSGQPSAATTPETRLRNIVQQASAGTGKTFALSNRFLQLLADGAEPDTILASTFTRKGAGEILDRILTRLGAAAVNEQAAQSLSHELDRRLDCQSVRFLLRKIVGCLPNLQIGTLDSFFNRIARAFCFEIGLPPDWEVVDPLRTRVIRDQAIESILGEERTAQLLRLMSKAEADRRVADLLAKTVDGLFEVYRDSTAAAWEQFGNPRPVSDQELAAFVERLEQQADLPSQIEKQRDKLVHCLKQKEWENAAGLGLVKKVRDQETHFSRQLIPVGCQTLVAECLQLIKRQVGMLVASRTKATHDLLARFDAVLQPLQLEAGELEFSDVTFHLARTVQLQPRQVAERLGRKIEHLLLDEFQDTAPLQWAVLKPLADHVTRPGSGRTFFCVGDRKQAIYGWRGGVDRIFDAVEQDFGRRIETAPPLLESYRSCQPVLDLVNAVFGDCKSLAAQDSDPVASQVLRAWSEKFQPHLPARPELNGFAEVKLAPAATENDADGVLAETIAEVKRLYERYPDKEIAVLFRGNAPIAQVAVHLQLEGIATSEEAGNPLTDSAAVETILSALTLADHPGDGVARFHLSHSPLGRTLGLVPETKATQSANIEVAHKIAATIRGTLLNPGYGPTVRGWARILGANCTEREAQRLEQLVEIAFAYDATWTLRPFQFVEHVRQQRVADRTGARVRLMTMHASKGLGFDIVVAPLNKSRSGWTSSPPEVVTGRSDPAGPIDAVSRYVRSDDRPLLPERIQRIFNEYQAQQINEELCLLYVTLTRAKHHLSVIVPANAEPDWANVVGILLRSLSRPNENRPETIAAFGSPDWLPPTERPGSPKISKTARLGEKSVDSPIALATSGTTGRGAEWVRPSARRQRKLPWQHAQNQPAELPAKAHSGLAPSELHGHRQAAKVRGVAWHSLLQQVAWLESIPPRDSLVRSLGSLVAEQANREQFVDQLLTQLSKGELCDWLSESSYRDGVLNRTYSSRQTLIEPLRLDVHREFTFVVELSEGWIEGQIDRLILISEGEQIVAAEVLDFKTGEVTDLELPAVVQQYQAQLKWYCEAVGELFGLPEDQVRGFLGFTSVLKSQNEAGSRVVRCQTKRSSRTRLTS